MRQRVLCFDVLTALAGLLFLNCPAYSQISMEEARREKLETVEELRRTEKVFGRSSWMTSSLYRNFGWRTNVGGWVSTSYTGGDNNDRNAALPDVLDHSWDQELRFFMGISSGTGRTNFYSRLGTTYTRNSRSSVAIRSSDLIQPTFDMLYISHSLPTGRWQHQFTFGRQFVMVERGISFSAVADGLRYGIHSPINDFQFFFLRQNTSEDNIDYLATGYGHSHRWFYGAEWKLHYHPDHQVGLFMAANKDRNNDSVDGLGQKHKLDSIYYGLGTDGRLFGKFLYWGQFIGESGKTYQSGGTTKIDVSASALDVGFRYFFTTAVAPSLYLEYAMGSGDKDATGNVVSTLGGSTTGKDQRFISFGGLNLGYALAPQLSNIQVIKLGSSFKPFGWSASRRWSNLSVQPVYYIYSRPSAPGATSDPYISTAAGASSNIGNAYDLTVAWKAAVDANYQLKFGRFNPGSAYTTRSNETYLRLKVSLDL